MYQAGCEKRQMGTDGGVWDRSGSGHRDEELTVGEETPGLGVDVVDGRRNGTSAGI